jgi:hypothetical protein
MHIGPMVPIVALTFAGGALGLVISSVPYLLFGFSFVVLDFFAVIVGISLGGGMGSAIATSCTSTDHLVASLGGLFLLNVAVAAWYQGLFPDHTTFRLVASIGTYSELRIDGTVAGSVLAAIGLIKNFVDKGPTLVGEVLTERKDDHFGKGDSR